MHIYSQAKLTKVKEIPYDEEFKKERMLCKNLIGQTEGVIAANILMLNTSFLLV